MLLNILALAAMVGVAYMSAVQGVYRAVQILAACIVAGVLAFGLCGPLAGLGPSTSTGSIWYYAGDAFFLWAVFCLAFLGLRMAADQFLPNQPALPYYINFPGGAVVGLLTGYLAVGVCLVLVQVLPVAPDVLGYSPFNYVPAQGEAQYESLTRGDSLWLSWDRGALTFFGYLSSTPLGSDAASFYNRYGDVYPPPEMRPADYNESLNVDDVLYYHWYRRYQASGWRGYWLTGPVPRGGRTVTDGVGLPPEAGCTRTLNDVDVRVLGVTRGDTLEDFPQERPPAGEEFLRVTLLFKPVGQWPRTVDSNDFLLVTSRGEKLRNPPRVYGATRASKQPNEVVLLPTAPKADLRNVRFAAGQEAKPGHYLADGATFDFAAPRERDLRTFIFTVPKKGSDAVRLLLEPAAAPAKPEAAPATPAKPEATPATPAKPGPAKAPTKP